MANDVYTYIDSTGLIETDAATIQAQVSAEYVAAFGADLVVPDENNIQASSTPQGLLINAETQARIAVADNNASLANQINPNVSGGVFLDAIMALTGSTRTPATQSVVYATLNGTPGTIIPAGSLASETGSGLSYQYKTYADATIGVSGYVNNVRFDSVLYGAIPCDATKLTVIISNIVGWDSISNSTAPDPIGADVQSDASARLSRNIQIAGQGSSTAGSIISAVSKVLGTTGSVIFLENYNNTTTTVSGVSMVAHSIYVCVYSSLPTAQINGTKSTVTAALTGTPYTIIPAASQISETASSYANVFALDNNVPFVLSGTLTSSSTTVAMTSTAGVFAGQAVTGTGIPSSTTVSSVVVDTSIVISNAATVSGAQDLTFTSVNWQIPASGILNAPFSSFSYGLVAAPIGSLSTIVTPVSGWVSVTNAADAVLGTSSAVAYAITSKKSAGSNYNNGASANPISALVIVPYSNQQINVLYDVATRVQISVSITVKVITPVQNAVDTVRAAINAYATGQLTGIPGLVVGQNISSFEISGAVTSQYPGIYVQNCYISKYPANPTSSAEIAIGQFEIGFIDPASIQVIIE